jgi:hypothetical protein
MWYRQITPSSKSFLIQYAWLSYHIRSCINFTVEQTQHSLQLHKTRHRYTTHTHAFCNITSVLRSEHWIHRNNFLIGERPGGGNPLAETPKRIHFVRIRTKNRLTAQRCGRSGQRALQTQRLALFICLSAQAALLGFLSHIIIYMNNINHSYELLIYKIFSSLQFPQFLLFWVGYKVTTCTVSQYTTRCISKAASLYCKLLMHERTVAQNHNIKEHSTVN